MCSAHVRFRGLSPPVHIGDVVLLHARDDSLATPAQVLLFASAPASAAPKDRPQPWIAYRLGAFAAAPLRPDWQNAGRQPGGAAYGHDLDTEPQRPGGGPSCPAGPGERGSTGAQLICSTGAVLS